MKNLENHHQETPPPIFGTWNRIYGFVLCFHALLILVLYWFTIHFK